MTREFSWGHIIKKNPNYVAWNFLDLGIKFVGNNLQKSHSAREYRADENVVVMLMC